MRRQRRGFTLVELLVVIAIIGILAAMVLGALSSVFSGTNAKVARAQIQQLLTALTVYEEKFNDYPPTFHEAFKGNRINEGNESLVACLSSKKKGGPFFDFKADRLQNLDLDSAPKPLSEIFGSTITKKTLFEFMDPWERPYVYFHGNDLSKDTKAKYTAVGGRVDVSPAGQDKTGAYPGAGRYQIFSLGEDGLPDDPKKGEGDNVTSWSS